MDQHGYAGHLLRLKSHRVSISNQECTGNQMDDFDRASEAEQRDRDLCIERARKAKTKVSTGHCAYCNEVVPGDRVYCDSECREFGELEARARTRNGR